MLIYSATGEESPARSGAAEICAAGAPEPREKMQRCLFTHPGPGTHATAGSLGFCTQPRGHGRLLLVKKPHGKHHVHPNAAAPCPKQLACLCLPNIQDFYRVAQLAGITSTPRSIICTLSTALRAMSLSNNNCSPTSAAHLPSSHYKIQPPIPQTVERGSSSASPPGPGAAPRSLPCSGRP